MVLLVCLQILTYTEAVKTVDHDKALGKPNSLWIAFAKFYEKHGDVDNARVIFNKAVQVQVGVLVLGCCHAGTTGAFADVVCSSCRTPSRR